MTLDVTALAHGMTESVPLVGTLGITFASVSADGTEVVADLPDRADLHNHVGGPHAGAMFSLAETASGAVVLSAFGEQLADAVPLAVGARIAYRKLAMGDVRATARLTRPVADVVAELASGVRPEFDVEVQITRADGAVTAEMTVTWTLRPNR
jgi:acyl-coenzyme A thioesterase PaaI-like protein